MSFVFKIFKINEKAIQASDINVVTLVSIKNIIKINDVFLQDLCEPVNMHTF